MSAITAINRTIKASLAALALVSCDKQDTQSSEKLRVPPIPQKEKIAAQAGAEAGKQKVIAYETKKTQSLQDIVNNTPHTQKCPERVFMLNPLTPDTKLLPGTKFRILAPTSAKDLVPNIDTDKNYDPTPIKISMQAGHTLWLYSETFKVPLDLLIAMNCREGEREVTRLKEGREITIPMVQVISTQGKETIYLEGLSLADKNDAERIALRLLKQDRGDSFRRSHLATAMQHFGPARRYEVIESIACALERIADKQANQSKAALDIAGIAKPYADALRQAYTSYQIDNPIRISPLSLLEVITNRQRLESDPKNLGEKIAVVISADGDSNGAFSSVNKVIEKAMLENVSTLYYQVGSLSEIKQIEQRLKSDPKIEVDYLIIGGHGAMVSKKSAPLLQLGYRSTIVAASSNLPALMDLQLRADNTNALNDIAGIVKNRGSIAFISCFSGQESQNGDNLVNRLASAAGKAKKCLTIMGCTEATNIKEISFADPAMDISYQNGQTYKLSSAIDVQAKNKGK
jgi:hypothetical protein